MNNKNYTIKELTDILEELAEIKYGSYAKYPHTVGVLSAILDGNLRGLYRNLQDSVNFHAGSADEELRKLKLKKMEAVANSAKEEELYA